LRSVAREFNVQPTQIRKWKKILDRLNQQLESNDEGVKLMQKMDKHPTCQPGGGAKQTFDNNSIKHLNVLYDNKRKANESVGALHLQNEVCKLDPINLDIEENILGMRIY
jgi:hypothetical protein